MFIVVSFQLWFGNLYGGYILPPPPAIITIINPDNYRDQQSITSITAAL